MKKVGAVGLSATVGLAVGWGLCAWNLRPQPLPPPWGADAVLLESLASAPPVDVARARRPYRGGLAGLKAIQDRQAQFAEDFIRERAEKFKVKIRPDTVGGVGVFYVEPAEVPPAFQGKWMIHLHGGSFYLGRGWDGLMEPIELARHLGLSSISIDYRLAPDHPAPAALEDAVTAWREILKTTSPASLALGGSSAGGTLSLAAAQRLQELGLPLPRALYLGSAVAVLDGRLDSRRRMEGVDRLHPAWGAENAAGMEAYARVLGVEHPSVSPYFGKFEGLPPTLLVAGTRDLMLSDAVLLHHKLKEARVSAQLALFEGHSHGDYLVMDFPPHYRELGAFLSQFWGPPTQE